jgi:RHS repeat-associated protein
MICFFSVEAKCARRGSGSRHAQARCTCAPEGRRWAGRARPLGRHKVPFSLPPPRAGLCRSRFDAVGNRTAMTSVTPLSGTVVTTYACNAANRLVLSSSKRVTAVDGVAYTWDDRGDLVHDGVFTYTYDAAGRMVGAEGVAQTLAYTYTADGLRVAQSVGGEVTTFVWDLASPLAQVLATSDGAAYVHGLDLVAERRSGAWAYPLGDALGSVRQWTDGDGYVTYAGGYTPFGTQLWTEGSTSSNWGYTGEWWDARVGMVYLRARWYDESTGRFTQVDPVAPDYQRPQSGNRYAYVWNHPLRFVDPTGLFPTRYDIEQEYAEFSCKCGWIDWNHVRVSDGIGYALLDDLDYTAYNFGEDARFSNNWGIHVGIPLGVDVGPIHPQIDWFSDYAVVPHNQTVSIRNREQLAVSIFMSANERFEILQGTYAWLPGFGDNLQSSYYSEEDLPSDIIGFYIGLQRFRGEARERVYQRVRDMCGAVGKTASLDVFEETYGSGSRAVANWRIWHARVLPLTGCNSHLCRCADSSCGAEGTRTWPSQLAALTSSRTFPNRGGNWWWYGGALRDGYIYMTTGRERVIRFWIRGAYLRPSLP